MFRLLLGIAVCGMFGMGSYALIERNSRVATEAELVQTSKQLEEALAETDTRISTLEMALSSTTAQLILSEEARENYRVRLEEREEEFRDLSDQVKKISGTVGVLDKLSKTDPELLMKYSKVYFLSENYIPEKLTQIAPEYSSVPTDQYIEKRVYPFLKKMLDDANDDGIDIAVRSAYRSFDVQRNLKGEYSVSYGSGANAFSADQGYSEHQLGTTVDLVSPENGNQLNGFDTTKAFSWLEKNAHTYGFTLSYPQNNSYYVYEPWHWRYVGKELASDLHRESKYFYDLDQREIDTYLVNVFE